MYMMMNKSLLFALLLAFGLVVSCDDTTGAAGWEVMPSGDDVTTSSAIFSAPTRSVLANRVLITTSHSYLGCVIDPETDAMTRSSFLAQYHVMEDMALPDKGKIIKDESDQPVCDSCRIRLYFTKYFGDSLTTMKVRVRELNPDNIMEEGKAYYSDLDPSEYISPSPRIDQVSTYSIYDPKNPNAGSTASAYYRSITLKVPSGFGANILQDYYVAPQHFANSYEFIHNVFPGLYFESTGGVGNMLDVEFSTLDIYYSYHGETSDGRDTIYAGLTRFAATEEVLQNTTVDTSVPESLLDASNPFTLLKSPAGVYTEMTIPVDEIFGGEHSKDTLNSAQLMLDKYTGDEDFSSPYQFPAPTNILLLPKADLQSFFESGKLPDSQTSFMAKYTNGSYAFNNISRLIKSLFERRNKAAGVSETDSETQRISKVTAYNEANPDWNKVIILPVDAEYTSVTSLYTTSDMLTRLRNALGLSTIRLMGGGGTSPQIRCIYSHFE